MFGAGLGGPALAAGIFWKCMSMITITVEGTPRPQGSKRHVGRGIMVESSKYVAGWREWVRHRAIEAMCGIDVIEKPNPVFVEIVFGFDRPQKHFRSNGQLRDDAAEYHTGKPDVDKLLRAILDSMTGIVFRDDSQVMCRALVKRYTKAAQTTITISEHPQ